MFTSTALVGKAFSAMEAEDPFDLCRQLLPSSEPCKDCRMWIEVSAPATGDPFWFDVCLMSMSTDIYKAVVAMWDGAGELNTVIRKAKEKSPTNFTEATAEMSIAPSSLYETCGAHALNVIEPFTKEDISEASANLIPLHFPNKEWSYCVLPSDSG